MSNDNRYDYEIQLPFGPPPVLPDVKKQLKEYVICPERLPIHDPNEAQKFWPREPNPSSLYHFDVAPLGTTLKVDRDPTTGKLLDFREVPLDNMGCTAKNSMSLRRAPGPPNDAIRGGSNSCPFWPGGFPELLLKQDENIDDSDIDFVNNLLTVPPGFERGIKFKTDGKTPIREDEIQTQSVSDVEAIPDIVLTEKEKETTVVNLMSLVKQEEDLLGLWQEEAKKDEMKNKEKIAQKVKVEINVDDSEVVPKEDIIPVLKISETKEQIRTEWAEELEVSSPVTDFEKKIPVMAKTWPFELDTFQKKAILKLEEHSNVFVAAHTSAGKTVVAEYAIALSKRHMTKTIYTSPIKALSNQKYRDFKETFGDVGLITGDVQINSTAQCLIMTTEILRSMLYRGSEVIRDLEYVIFDEVHYINDSERGHVWEEVLILLPSHISIVMLSATVPNTLEFANWVGSTKQKKMYVISTLKRPVPLEHYLYICTGKVSNLFLILDGDGNFKEQGYRDAVDAKKEKDSKKEKDKKPNKDSRRFETKQGKGYSTPKDEARIWVSCVNYLKEHNKLPVIAFTLSRNRCDNNSKNLTGVDLTTSQEKKYIQRSFMHYVQKLKPPDRRLPQIMKLKDLLNRGIGIHHSGILPILKEIVEILFQTGYVKLLFATETFAMGVNMPARTVVFDSIDKYDGHGMRTLMAAEYIQMAGRAGRRSLDKTGTVIIMCKAHKEVPSTVDLRGILLGKPTTLQSKFRLTYSMILNLFRLEKISMEGMMLHSFLEFKHKRKHNYYKKKLQAVEENLKEMSTDTQHGSHWESLCEFYDVALKFIKLKSQICEVESKKNFKLLTPGRVLLVKSNEHVNKLGILLDSETSRESKFYKVLVLCNDTKMGDGSDEIQLSITTRKEEKNESPLWLTMIGLASKGQIFVPDGLGGHTIIKVSSSNFDVVKSVIDLDTKLIIQDWEKRQLPRFSGNPPGKTCSQAVQQLTEFTQNVNMNTVQLILEKSSINAKDPGTWDDSLKLQELESDLNNCTCTNIANFKDLFAKVFKRKQLEEERNELEFKLSSASLSLNPEFKDRVKFLQELKYIDSKNKVQLKGQVACQMGNHELMITEIVLHNILTERQPAEIAALLSCLIFQQRTTRKPNLTSSLKEGIEAIKEVAATIRKTEEKYQLVETNHLVETNERGVQGTDVETEYQELNFGLVEVVYKWAQKKAFAEIMPLTDVQEGIVVRCIQQLNETLRDVKNAAHIIGDPVLKQKMEEASEAIKRDIVFAVSLYTSEDKPKDFDETLLPVGDE